MQIEEILRRYNVPFRKSGEHHHVRGGWCGVSCYLCHSSDFHAGISPSGRAAVCWRCGKLRIDELLSYLTKEPPKVVRSWLDKLSSGRQLPDKVERSGKLQIPSGVGPLQEPHADYLRSRGFDPAYLVKRWGIKGIGIAADLSWRVFIPIDYHGRTVSWTTRAIGDAALRYISASPEQEEINHRHLLFGADYAGHQVIVLEGPFAVFKVGYGAVATLGIGYSNEQLSAISRYPSRCICFDNEPLAQKRAEKLCADLEAFPGKTYRISLETGKSADDADDWEIEEIRQHFL